jgi:tetratricopeptide (TPR) repeat protein/tRNA A-37 threonylcarbamoyl transferase component Bud32
MVRTRLGAGGMGEVYKADDTILKRVVAIKRLSARLRNDPASHHRLMVEARRACALNHPHIAAVYDIVEEKGELFLVMECVEGITLRQRLKQSALTLEEFLPIAIQCSEALAAAHDKGVVHGDIKPDNIMLTPDGQVKLLDFGVARRMSDSSPAITMDSLPDLSGPVAGTPAYMAPEVLRGGNPDRPADIFALGIVFYECLGGIHPFRENTAAFTAARIFNDEPKALGLLNASLPKEVEHVVGRMLAKQVAERYANATELADDLRAVQAGMQSGSLHTAAGHKFRRMVMLGVASAVLAVLLAVSVVPSFRETARRWLGGGPAVPGVTQLVVLPFTTAESDPHSKAFADGLAETVNAKLTQLTGRKSLQVVPASEVQDKHVTDAQQARREFGANMVLTGNLHRAGDRLRVTYSLVDTKTRLQLRSDAITVTDDDPFAAEDKVVEGVANMLQIELAPHERKTVEAHGTEQPAAYDYYVQGRGYLQEYDKLENVDNAIAVFKHALEEDPQYALAFGGLGEAYYRKFHLTKDASLMTQAREACQRAVTLRSDEAAGHICLGLVSNGTGQYEQAVVEFQRAALLEPTSDEAYAGLGNAYEQLGKTELAEKTYKQAIALRPSYWRGYNWLGTFYLRNGRFAEAINQFEQLLKLAPDSFVGYANLASAYFAQGRYAEAIPIYQRSISIQPIAGAYSNLAYAYFAQKQFAQSARTNEEAVRLNQRDYSVWGNLGDSYYWAPGERGKAADAYSKAIALAEETLQINPRDADMLSDVAYYYAMLGKKQKAREDLAKALALEPHSTDVLSNAALIQVQFGDNKAALSYLQQAVAAGYSRDILRVTPNFDSLRGDPAFQKLVTGH